MYASHARIVTMHAQRPPAGHCCCDRVHRYATSTRQMTLLHWYAQSQLVAMAQGLYLSRFCCSCNKLNTPAVLLGRSKPQVVCPEPVCLTMLALVKELAMHASTFCNSSLHAPTDTHKHHKLVPMLQPCCSC